MPLLEIGQRVSVKGELGVIRFLGSTKFAAGEWIGIELDTGSGKNDGSLQGVRYFLCQKQGNYGVFVRPSVLGVNPPNEKIRPSLEVQVIVDKLQTKLRAARAEIDKNKKDLEEAHTELVQKSSLADDLETNLERISVEADYLKSQNITLSIELQQLQASYANMSAEYEILQEEMELNKELEEEVRSQVRNGQTISPEDFQLVVQHNNKLELAISSIRKLSSDKENKFTEEIMTLNSEIAGFEELKKTYEKTAEKLKQAEAIILQLQEQLESANELDQIIEYLTRENENLTLRNTDLSETVNELQEIHELDKTLEENLRKVEEELKEQLESFQNQIAQEKERVGFLTSKHELLRNEIKTLKAQPKTSTAGENVELEALRIELKTLRVQLEASNFKYNVSERDLAYLESFNVQLVPQKYQQLIAILQKLGQGRSIVSEILVLLAASNKSALKIGVENKLDQLHLLLNALSYLLEHEYEDLPLDPLGSQLQLLVSDVQNIFETLHFENANSLDILSSHLDKLQSLFGQLAKLPKTISFYYISLLLLEINYSSAICSEILKFISEKNSSVHQFEKLKVQTSLAKQECEFALHEVNKNKTVKPEQLEKLPAIELREYTNGLLSVYRLLESDTSLDFESAMSTSQLQKYINVVSDVLDILKDSLNEVDTKPAIFQYLHERQVEAPVLVTKDLGPELIEKDKIINDLKLNIEVLEKNMGATIKGKSFKIHELKEMLHQTQAEFQLLEISHKKLVTENKALDNQVQSLFELSALQTHSQIRAFEDLKSKKNYTTEMALAEEVSMLRNMVLLSSQRRGNDYLSWLREPIYPQYKAITNGELVAFEARAHETRALASGILKKILSSKSTSIA